MKILSVVFISILVTLCVNLGKIDMATVNSTKRMLEHTSDMNGYMDSLAMLNIERRAGRFQERTAVYVAQKIEMSEGH